MFDSAEQAGMFPGGDQTMLVKPAARSTATDTTGPEKSLRHRGTLYRQAATHRARLAAEPGAGPAKGRAASIPPSSDHFANCRPQGRVGREGAANALSKPSSQLWSLCTRTMKEKERPNPHRRAGGKTPRVLVGAFWRWSGLAPSTPVLCEHLGVYGSSGCGTSTSLVQKGAVMRICMHPRAVHVRP